MERLSVISKVYLGLGLYNALVFLVYGWDKRKAIDGKWRTPEATLLWLAAALGGPGALAGMVLWHHKTRKLRFALGVPLLVAVQAVGFWWGHVHGFW